jgi:hypothetical protein
MRDELLAMLSHMRAAAELEGGVGGAVLSGGVSSGLSTSTATGGSATPIEMAGAAGGSLAAVDRLLGWKFSALKGELQVSGWG